MKRLLIFFCFFAFQSQAQFSLSAGYNLGFLGEKFRHNQVNLQAHWFNNRFQFSTELGFTNKKLDYLSDAEDYYYDNGPPGYYYSSTRNYTYKALVYYSYLNVGIFGDWSVIHTSKFKLFLGYFLSTSARVNETEKNHITESSSTYSSVLPWGSSTEHKDYPVSNEPFNAVDVSRINMAIGFKLSPRQEFGQFYIQLDGSFGRLMRNVYQDAAGSCVVESDCFSYKPLFNERKGLFFATGFSIGHFF